MEIQQNEQSTNDVTAIPQEPVQVDQVNDQVPTDKPALSARRHFKFFSIILVLAIIAVVVVYYQSHALPDFIQSTADSLLNRASKNTVYQSVTTIEQGETYQVNNQRYIVESVGRSETVYVSATIAPAQQGEDGN